jgi:hypothetical protein
MVVHLNREYQTRANGFTIQKNSAGATYTDFAADVRSRERQMMTDEI